MGHTRTHQNIVVSLNDEINDHLDELIWLDDKNIEHAKAIREALLILMDYAMDEAVAKDHR